MAQLTINTGAKIAIFCLSIFIFFGLLWEIFVATGYIVDAYQNAALMLIFRFSDYAFRIGMMVFLISIYRASR